MYSLFSNFVTEFDLSFCLRFFSSICYAVALEVFFVRFCLLKWIFLLGWMELTKKKNRNKMCVIHQISVTFLTYAWSPHWFAFLPVAYLLLGVYFKHNTLHSRIIFFFFPFVCVPLSLLDWYIYSHESNQSRSAVYQISFRSQARNVFLFTNQQDLRAKSRNFVSFCTIKNSKRHRQHSTTFPTIPRKLLFGMYYFVTMSMLFYLFTFLVLYNAL